jgi:hypothetical protein
MPTKVGIHGFSVDKLRRGWRAFAHHDGSDNGTHRSKSTAPGITRSRGWSAFREAGIARLVVDENREERSDVATSSTALRDRHAGAPLAMTPNRGDRFLHRLWRPFPHREGKMR